MRPILTLTFPDYISALGLEPWFLSLIIWIDILDVGKAHGDRMVCALV
jgi:hypothetical protein